MLITIYNRANPNFKEIISKHWPRLSRSSATRHLERENFMVSYRNPSYLKAVLIKNKIPQPSKPGCAKDKNAAYLAVKFPNQGSSRTYTTRITIT